MHKILIVDDDPSNLEALKHFFQSKRVKWSIRTAESEEEFERVFDAFHPEIVISDLVMRKDQSGMNVLRYAREKDELTMVILVTAFELKLDRYRAFEFGAFDCIQKNMTGVIASEEIFVKTQAAINFRELALRQVKNERLISSYRRYFDRQVFEMVEKDPSLLHLHRQTLTLCFWDVRGFTLLCEILKANPELISGFLQEYFDKAAEIISANHGLLDKFIGDCVMALFGSFVHERHEEDIDAVNAVRAAIALNQQFDEIVKKWMKTWVLYTPNVIDVGLGCGIHTGEVLVGNVGTDIRDQYTALGPSVNFAKRLEGLAKKRQILISTSTEARVKGSFMLKSAGTIQDLKNMPGGVYQMFEVLVP